MMLLHEDNCFVMARIETFQVAQSLAAGCTMVVKPAEQAPLSALYYAHMTKLVHGFVLHLWLVKQQKCLTTLPKVQDSNPNGL
ncbi:hypothetical protein ACET3Z_008269 [Daucus carota]